MANVKHRGHLEELNENVRQDDALYREVRQATHEFREGLIEVFFDEKSGLADLTKSYGVF